MGELSLVSARLVRNLAVDAWRAHAGSSRTMLPVAMTHFVTWRCNLRCSFCNVRASGDPAGRTELGTDDCVRLLEILREGVPHLHLTGGEPLVRPDVARIAAAARALGFRSLGLASNLSLLDRQPEVLDHVTHVFASLHAFDEPGYAARPPAPVARALENFSACAALQQEKGFRLVADLVLNATSLPRLDRILAWCFERGASVTVGPQLRRDGTVDPALRADAAWRGALDGLAALRRGGAPLFDGEYYLRAIRDLAPFRCHPGMTPATSPAGMLFVPCRIRPRGGVDVLAAGSWREASRRARELSAPPPDCGARCHAACAVVPSGAAEHPLLLLRDLLAGARRGVARPAGTPPRGAFRASRGAAAAPPAAPPGRERR